MIELNKKIRETEQFELPLRKTEKNKKYDIYPGYHLEEEVIGSGYDGLAKQLQAHKVLKIDGYVGVLFESVQANLNEAFKKTGVQPVWINMEDALLDEPQIDSLIEPYLGGDDPVFGRLSALQLQDFFDSEKLKRLVQEYKGQPVIYYGIGASLVPVEAKLVYIDISKNEIQFRSRAGSIKNLGSSAPKHPKKMYKRFYFVDWVVLNKHKKEISREIEYLADGQRSSSITWMEGEEWHKAMNAYVQSPIRVRPWFEPGAWGGSWIKENIDGLSEDVVNYAWSFELIVPENGVIFESSGYLLEFSFDFLMYENASEILGKDFEDYGYEFPIRFDFLDTFDGGNLSIQCHPQKAYMKQHFGENITQEETYYILDRKNDAQVYLGFQEGVTPKEFQAALEHSVEKNEELEITKYVQAFDAKKHELYLIPPGTIHGSGRDNMVLEISSTPYIYTFKMYDWLRVDLDGKPRPINIERGMDNLVFERAGKKVEEELIAKPVVLEENGDYCLEHLKTHQEHLYDVHRIRIKPNSFVEIDLGNQCHILSLVEGHEVEVQVGDQKELYYYAETFVLPAAASTYSLYNSSEREIMLVKAFVK